MRKLLILIFISVLVYGCKKDEIKNDAPVQQEVSFAIDLVDPGSGMKDWECKVDAQGNLLEPDYAQVTISGADYFPLVFRIDGILYTQNIKLDLPVPVGGYIVTQFLLWDDGNTPGGTLPEADDQIVMGTPASGSPYEVYIAEPYRLDYVIDVLAFEKIQIPIEVLCFQDDEYTEFGFDWFVITEIVIREQCFFGDICVKHPDDYIGSLYENQSTGLQLDMPAIVELHVFKDGTPVPYSPFTNATADANWGVGAPLCIQYPDNLQITGEVFTVELWILVKWGDTFVYKLFHTWTFIDNAMIPDGTDGIVEFVLGNCNLMNTDLQLAPYQDLPTMANITLSGPGDPGYNDLFVNTVTPAGTYDLPVGVNLAGWCGDYSTCITAGTFDVFVHTSLYDINWPAGMPFSLVTIGKVNWLFNHLDYYGMDINTLTQADGVIIQSAIWKIISSIACTGVAAQMAADAETYGVGYVPPPGGWAAALFVVDNDSECYQLIFTVVDP
ncbi:MAG: hypothetical protein DRI83_04690 [Bacteroidetes bacterium]|nr:MAG: hypothetical protein DRI83_04690 [Bacteroidota bacterium]